jgi:nicotinamidase/pyrazinamidase
MKKLRILQIGDMQNGFTRERGNLYVPGAEEIIGPANDFLRQVNRNVFDLTFIILDTHFAEEYGQSEEGKIFPIHCEYGTPDWELSLDISGLSNIWFLTKNQFNLWSDTGLHAIAFADQIRRNAYHNLFHFVDDLHEPTQKIPRDAFIQVISPDQNPANIEVTQIGVASDYCNRFAMEGWLNRGASVTIVRDLTKGIEKETPQVIDECQYKQYRTGKLKTVLSAEYIRNSLCYT